MAINRSLWLRQRAKRTRRIIKWSISIWGSSKLVEEEVERTAEMWGWWWVRKTRARRWSQRRETFQIRQLGGWTPPLSFAHFSLFLSTIIEALDSLYGMYLVYPLVTMYFYFNQITQCLCNNSISLKCDHLLIICMSETHPDASDVLYISGTL